MIKDLINNFSKITLFSGILLSTYLASVLSDDIKKEQDFMSSAELISEDQKNNVIWEPVNEFSVNQKSIYWEPTLDNEDELTVSDRYKFKRPSRINSFNRSIVFDNNVVGPDISWLVPPGLSWNHTYKFDGSIRGHNRREKGESFFGWNEGDAVGQFYYQPIHLGKASYGINIGVRSVYQGAARGGGSEIGEGLSLGFRYDRELSDTSGFAFGAEQLLHLDNKTDTGRDIYLTFTKGWWKDINGINSFPLHTATAGFATGKMAEGNIKGLCSDLLGGAGTETAHKRPLCWAPVFTLSRVFNESLSTFFEYNSKWFLLGTSFAPSQNIPLRGTFAVQLSDHIENYQINDFDSLKWVFRLSLGF